MPTYQPKPPSRLPVYLSRLLAISAVMVYLLLNEFFSEELTLGGQLTTVQPVQPNLYLWVFGLGGLAYFLRWWHRGEIQRYLNNMARYLLSSPTAAPYWLYLRPFSLDAAMPQNNPSFAGLLGLFSFDSRRRDFEELIREAVQRKGTLCLVGLGTPEGIAGAGRLKTSDTEWKEAFESLARFASRILVIPAGDSVRLEIEFLAKQGLLSKTVFLKPPTARIPLTVRSVLSVNAKPAFGRDEWEDATQEVARIGIRLPEYRRHAMCFVVSSNGDLDRQAVVKSLKPRLLSKGLKWVSADPLV